MENYKWKIPLRNKQKDIIDYTYVSKEDYEILNKYNFSKTNKGYCVGYINKKSGQLIHRYIIIDILKNNINSKVYIDHINNNKLDNRRENLRLVTPSENVRNRKKQENLTSKYMGVSWNSNSKKWNTSILIEKKTLYASYDKEEHAAHQYNIWLKEYNLEHLVNINIIPIQKDFILYKSNVNNKIMNLPTGIYTKNNKFRAIVNIDKKSKQIGVFLTIEEAVKARDKKLKEVEELKNKKILEKPIIKNKSNQAIIELFNNKKEKVGETIVDEDIYYDLIKYKWTLENNKYVHGWVGNKKLKLHRYILNYYGNDCVDHINNIRLDNRKCNLRIVTIKQNNMNKKKRKYSTSKYIGVYYNKSNKWVSKIRNTIIGYFENEIEAAKTRDIETKKVFGEYGNLNFPEV
jgi:hypothetical protein